jgi:hypothetical protein
VPESTTGVVPLPASNLIEPLPPVPIEIEPALPLLVPALPVDPAVDFDPPVVVVAVVAPEPPVETGSELLELSLEHAPTMSAINKIHEL